MRTFIKHIANYSLARHFGRIRSCNNCEKPLTSEVIAEYTLMIFETVAPDVANKILVVSLHRSLLEHDVIPTKINSVSWYAV